MDEITVNSIIENEIIMSEKKTTVKMVAMRGVVLFPFQVLHFDILREKSLLAINKAMDNNEPIFLAAQKHAHVDNPAPKDIYRVGTLAKIKQVIKLTNDTVRVLVQGEERMEIDKFVSLTPCFEVTLKPVIAEYEEKPLIEAIKRRINESFDEYKKLEHKLPPDVLMNLDIEDTDKFISYLGNAIFHAYDDKQKLLQEKSYYKQLELIYFKLVSECEILGLEKKISYKVKKNIDKNQREYYLREQIKVLHEELGENEDEIVDFRKKTAEAKLPEAVSKKIEKELVRLSKMSPQSPESGVIRTYIEALLELPWDKQKAGSKDLVQARTILDEDHYGLEKVKERIIEYLAVNLLTDKLNAPILCFVGPPGVGKTSIVASIARASGREFVSMSLGGVRDEAEIRGHRRTYIGAMAGRIVSALKGLEGNNPVFLLDEIDKMSSDFRGDPASAMLEVLDHNQNQTFKDHYVELPLDLSKIMFVTTANTLDTIPLPLLDRMEVIELSGYTYEEKLAIARKYLLPKQLLAAGLEDSNVSISDDVMMSIISQYTRESGVRNLEREIATLIRKLAVKIVNENMNKSKKFVINASDLVDYLGIEKHSTELSNLTDEVGLATGLAWTSVGGKTLNIEVAVVSGGKGEIKLTGSLGDVMKESCQTALTLVRSRAAEYSIAPDKFVNYDIHIHVPEGATPKDGPSAGITMATALLSALSGKKIDKLVAMTGEVTLRGKVLPIGGLKEKSLAAYRNGIKTLIIPIGNKKDLVEIPTEVKDNLKIIFADTIDTVFSNAILNN